jgi:adenylate cyclase
VRRPHLMRRLVDGSPEDSGRTISRRATTLMIPAIAGANAIGGAVVLFLALYVVPRPEIKDATAAQIANFSAFGIFGVVAVLVGIFWGYRSTEPTRAWLVEDRAPDEEEQRRALRTPRRQLVVSATLWSLAVVVFVALNAVFSVGLALVVGIIVALGGATTSAIAYLLAERLYRPVIARALSQSPPQRPVTPGIIFRSLAAWALGTGVPVFGLALVAIASLAGRHVSNDQLAVTILGLGGISLVVGLFATWQAAHSVADPVISVREALNDVESGDFDQEVPVFDGSELGLLQAGFNRMTAGLREREEMRDLFGRQVGADVAKAALERGTDMGGETAEVGVLFTDVIGSTSLASERSPHEVVETLNAFFTVVIEVVEEHGGFVNKFEGDAALAVFGAPIPDDHYADSALAAARELAERLHEDDDVELDAGIGVSGGTALAGNIGTEQRYEYTVIGDPVNEAARLTELAKEEEGRVLASAAIVEAASEEEAGRWELGDSTELRGRSEPTQLARPRSAQASGSEG